jgi:phosphoribosylaminoimidazole carboxylase (NCAIR synthetase)
LNFNKTIAFLGAAGTQLSPILYAKRKGYRVITIDNKPENFGHAHSHKSYNVSITAHSEVLNICKAEKVDAVIGYASDIASETQAFIAYELGLVGPLIEANKILTNKWEFRTLLKEKGLQSIFFQKFEYTNLPSLKLVLESQFNGEEKFIIKPTDSAGSKGVYVFQLKDFDLEKAKQSFSFSRSKTIIVEVFIEKESPQICGDGFMLDGEIQFIDFGDGHFHDFEKLPVPFGETFPGRYSDEIYHQCREKLHAILSKLSYKGPFNFDIFLTKDGDVFINEIGPRSGGNYIPDVLGLKNEFDFVGQVVEFFLGNPTVFPSINNQNKVASYMIHSSINGFLNKVEIEESKGMTVISKKVFLKENDIITKFTAGNHTIGNLLLKFESMDSMLTYFDDLEKHVKVSFK